MASILNGTLEVLNKKHVKFGQGLDFCFSNKSRRQNYEQPKKKQTQNKNQPGKSTKSRVLFLTLTFLSNMFSVLSLCSEPHLMNEIECSSADRSGPCAELYGKQGAFFGP